MGRPKKSGCPQQSHCREQWVWLRRKLKIGQKNVIDELGISQPSVSAWEKDHNDFRPEVFQKALELLEQWREQLPPDQWVLKPYIYRDEGPNGPVWRDLDFREEFRMAKSKANYPVIVCNHTCPKCGKLTPDVGRFCMHCRCKVAPHRVPVPDFRPPQEKEEKVAVDPLEVSPDSSRQ